MLRFASSSALGLFVCVACADDTAIEGFEDVGIVDITVGAFHACVLNHDGRSWCWAAEPHLIAQTNERLNTIVAGEWHTCGLTPEQRVVCWGSGEDLVTDAPVEGRFVEVCGADGFACAREESGEVLCWGNGDSEYNGVPVTPRARPFAGPMKRLRCGSYGVCGVDEHDEDVCWFGPSGSDMTPPVPVVEFEWETHACGLTEVGEIVCWGDPEGSPELDAPPGVFRAIGVGFEFACALTPEGEIRCWGNAERASLEVAPPPGHFTRLAVGIYSACALREDGRVICWGHTGIDCVWGNKPIEGCRAIPDSIGEIYRPPT
ncbi:RCC1 domain-containing protein [Nannocystis radixulma]|uniref:non-specific serine/threonine protein kinase n=1 Tax=Nannocystis radixulma TaxID=2995305 RepID=A0ABT5B2K5_9BACT|nr:RCC1 domain-containing protein [Nannocystis radixulma]MDC0668334.1 RCC1 domain-containing protein [Nannocystis radixulma]